MILGVLFLLLAAGFAVIALLSYDISWELMGYEETDALDVWTWRIYATLALATSLLFGSAYLQMHMKETLQALDQETDMVQRL